MTRQTLGFRDPGDASWVSSPALGEADTLLEGEDDGDEETDELGDGEIDDEIEEDGLELIDAEILVLGESERDVDGDGDADGDDPSTTSTGPMIGAYRSVRTCRRNGTPHAPDIAESLPALGDGDTLLEGETLLETEDEGLMLELMLELILELMLLDGDGDEDGEDEIDVEIEDETDEDALLMISRTAKCTAARSSLVPDENPTLREPCPAVVSRTTTNPLAPASTDCSEVLLAPAVGSVWCPK